ncbi:HPP family protein [Pseudonocardia sp. H11422]|uniref:CBS domain-containing protein n=1 Tax=Pseudonocardia sp. H11422 TaxID=2835866 RepID=UPI001BDBD66E|nr:CBS domain-containing protein [Pseudonocardia sp. H11422]
MKAADVMSSPVITLRPDTPVWAAAALLVSHGFTAAPVVDADRRVIGIATEADLARNRIRPEGWPAPEERIEPTVARVMTGTPMSMRPEDDLADVVSLMLDGRIRSVPIVDDGVLVGIVSRRDVLRVLARRELTSGQVGRHRAGLPDHDRAEP